MTQQLSQERAHAAAGAGRAGDTRGGPFDLADDTAYRVWRDAKLAGYPRSVGDLVVDVADLARPAHAEIRRIMERISRCNMAIYATEPRDDQDPRGPREALTRFLAAFGLASVERHRSAESDGFVAIEVSAAPAKRGFIPYTTRPISWHTDGYYNGPETAIRAMLLHCVRSAGSGGENALLDPEIAYIRLRDADPRLVAALMHPEAMTIPPAIEEDGSERPVSVGPVFAVDGDGGLLVRYTARGRNIAWRDDAATREAVAFLERLLRDETEPLILKARLAAGQGLICNNVLHTRTGFEDQAPAPRLMLRARFATRLAAPPAAHA